MSLKIEEKIRELEEKSNHQTEEKNNFFNEQSLQENKQPNIVIQKERRENYAAKNI